MTPRCVQFKGICNDGDDFVMSFKVVSGSNRLDVPSSFLLGRGHNVFDVAAYSTASSLQNPLETGRGARCLSCRWKEIVVN